MVLVKVHPRIPWILLRPRHPGLVHAVLANLNGVVDIVMLLVRALVKEKIYLGLLMGGVVK
jgi:hypothetical protein